MSDNDNEMEMVDVNLDAKDDGIGEIREQDIEEGGGGDDDEEQKKKKEEFDLWTQIWQGLAGASIVFNLLAMIFNASAALVIIAGLIAIPVGGIVVMVQFQLQDLDSLRKVQNELRSKVNDFAKENTKLTANVDKLGIEAGNLKEIEEQLDAIGIECGKNATAICELVKENKQIQDEQKKLIEEDIIQSIMKVILDSDRDEDSTISDREAKRLMQRMMNLPAVNVNEDKLRDALQDVKHVDSMLMLVKNIEDPTLNDDERIFIISTDHVDLDVEHHE